MPIKPEDKPRYPANWREIRAAVIERAGNHCEWCGVENHQYGSRDKNGTFHSNLEIREMGHKEIEFLFGDLTPKEIRIVLTIAHLDHTPENCAPDNLAALCQKCHLNYDAQYHAMRRMETRAKALQVALPGGWIQTDIMAIPDITGEGGNQDGSGTECGAEPLSDTPGDSGAQDGERHRERPL